MNWRNRVKIRLIEYKGGKCSVCGYDKPIPSAYDFHHLDPIEKDFNISAKSLSFDRLKEEVDKCVLLCKNCHAEIHFEMSQEKRQERLKIQRTRFENKICQVCSVSFKPDKLKRKYCSQECASLAKRRVERPTKEQLAMEIKTESMLSLGRKYGVSDNAIRKWARSYNLGL
jgi:hypothetical protein